MAIRWSELTTAISASMQHIETERRQMRKPVIKLKRVYDPVESTDGTRFLVERLWPRGIKKTDLKIHDWLKDVAPSSTLRRWFGHDPGKWDEFRRRYFRELSGNVEALEPIVKASR